jgi:pimeloyl-ACP methyl ester carboxylesterase
LISTFTEFGNGPGVATQAVNVSGLVVEGVPEGIELTEGEQARVDRMQRFLAEGSGDWAYPAGSIDVEDVLTHATLYWLTNAGASSAQMYYASMHTQHWPTPSKVPAGVANFAEDIAVRQFAEQVNTITRWVEYDRGGHFAALEVPELFAGDVRAFFRTVR